MLPQHTTMKNLKVLPMKKNPNKYNKKPEKSHDISGQIRILKFY